MIQDDFHIANLIAKSLINELTEKEQLELDLWRNDTEKNEKLYRKITNEKNIANHAYISNSFSAQDKWDKIQVNIKKSILKKKWTRIIGYAATVIIPLLIVCLVTNLNPQKLQIAKTKVNSEQKRSIKQGTILYLDNGREICLNSYKKGAVQTPGYNQINLDSNTLDYQLASCTTSNKIMEYNSIYVPHGNEFKLILNDGTKVFVKSMTHLRYPIKFDKTKREVELEGEAYFEVAKNGTPFIVTTKEKSVEVLGTIFGISAYPDDDYQATLIKGSIKVLLPHNETHILKPSQQISVNHENNSVTLSSIDTSFYTSWVNGKINFRDQKLKDIMTILSRWYDIKVFYANEKIKDIRIGCNVDRSKQIFPFIHLLERTNVVHAKINGNTISFYN